MTLLLILALLAVTVTILEVRCHYKMTPEQRRASMIATAKRQRNILAPGQL